MPSRQASFDQGNGKEAVLQASLDSVVGLLKASEAQSERLARAFGEARAEHQAEIGAWAASLAEAEVVNWSGYGSYR